MLLFLSRASSRCASVPSPPAVGAFDSGCVCAGCCRDLLQLDTELSCQIGQRYLLLTDDEIHSQTCHLRACNRFGIILTQIKTRPKRPCFGRLQPRPPAPSNSSRTLNRPMRPTAARPARPSTRRYRLFSAPCGTSLFLIVPKLLYFRQYCKTFCIVIRREHVDRQGNWD